MNEKELEQYIIGKIEKDYKHTFGIYFYLEEELHKKSPYKKRFQFRATKIIGTKEEKIAIDIFIQRHEESYWDDVQERLQKELVPYLSQGYKLSQKVSVWDSDIEYWLDDNNTKYDLPFLGESLLTFYYLDFETYKDYMFIKRMIEDTNFKEEVVDKVNKLEKFLQEHKVR